jgi:uncharacterized protein (DUF2267 family)
MHIDRHALIEDVMWRGGIRDRAGAEAALEQSLEAVAAHLGADDRKSVAERLPASFAAIVIQPARAATAGMRDLYARIAAREKISLGRAVEYVQAAGGALAELLDETARELLVRRLPAEWSALFVPVAPASEADLPPGTQPGHGHTLATGRPGSLHPLAEAAPRGAQADSVAAAANPHADSKLSSSRGPAGGHPLATGRPGAEDPIAEATDERRGR